MGASSRLGVFALLLRVWPCLCLVSAQDDFWCQVKPGKCTGQRHAFEASQKLGLWDQIATNDTSYRNRKLKGLRFADWDTDRDIDIILADKGQKDETWQLAVLEQLSDGSFVSHTIAAIELDNFDVVDWNADGKLDVLVCHHDQKNDTIIITRVELSAIPRTAPQIILEISADNNAKGFADLRGESYAYWTGCGSNMQAIDFDQDGDPDLILGSRYFEHVSSGLVELAANQNPLGVITKNFTARLEKVFDWDGDGRLDILVRVAEGCLTFGCNARLLYLHQAEDGTFVAPSQDPFSGFELRIREEYAQEVQIVDWNSDGLLDLLMINCDWIYFRLEPEYYEHTLVQSVLPHSQFNPFKYIDLHGDEMHLTDWNLDGHVDVVVADGSCNGAGTYATFCAKKGALPLRLYQHESGKNLQEAPVAFQNVTSTHVGPFRVAVVDWDGDGDSDLIVAAFDGRLHYHEMVAGSLQEESAASVFANITFPTQVAACNCWSSSSKHPQGCCTDSDVYLKPRKRLVQPLAVDWDNDGDLDLVLGPDGWFWERLDDGTLLEWPLDKSPFGNMSEASDDLFGDHDLDHDLVWRFVDCDGDGDFDLLRLRLRESPVREPHLQACRHDGAVLKCDVDFTCFGMNLTDFHGLLSSGGDMNAIGAMYTFDTGDLDGDGKAELVSAHTRDNRMWPWSPGFCTPPDACHKKGLCQADSEVCACITGHDLQDCSGCEVQFYSVLRGGLGQMHDCAPCPGSNGEVCHGRGTCFDDFQAKALADSSSAVLMAHGNGSCSCSETIFGGIDEAGRQTCAEGSCSAGTEEKDGRCHRCDPGHMSSEGGICRACGPGTFSSMASDHCLSCPLGAVVEEAGSSACTDCPAGKHEAKRQFCSDCPPGTMSATGSGSCSPCKAGFHAANPGSSACESCPAGMFSEGNSAKCSACPVGTISEVASATCSQCKAGQIARNSLTCEGCPAGTYAPEGSNICRACPHGHVSSAESSSCFGCESMLLRMMPDPRQERCTVFALDIALALLAWITLSCSVAFFSVGWRSKLPLEDMSMQGDKYVATTSLPHFFLRWDWASPKVFFTGTGVPDLDSPDSVWTSKAQSMDELIVQREKPAEKPKEEAVEDPKPDAKPAEKPKEEAVEDPKPDAKPAEKPKEEAKEDPKPDAKPAEKPKEKSIDRPLDTSMGYLHVKFPMAFLATGSFGLPLVCWCFLFLAAGVASLSRLLWPMILLICGSSLLTGLGAFCVWCRRGRQTSLLKRRRQFLRDLEGGPVRCARGPERSITAGKLQDFLQFFNAFIKERSMYYVCANIVKPLTEPFKVSLVELLGPVEINWFVSHSWQMPVRHFGDSVFKHAQSDQKAWRESAYWICTFSNNQWDVKAELGNGRWQESSFYLSLVSPCCKGTTMIIDELVQPLQRIWCLFEVYQTIRLSHNGASQGLLLCTSTGVLQQGNAGTDVAVAVARKVARLDTRAAEATSMEDRMMIHALIEQMPGGFDTMNTFLKDTISDALKSSHIQYEKAFADLVHDLGSQPGRSHLPTLLTSSPVRTEAQKDSAGSKTESGG